MISTVGGLTYCVLRDIFAEDARDVISESFADEPTSVHLTASREDRLHQWVQYTSIFHLEVCITCVMNILIICKVQLQRPLCGMYGC